MGKPDFVIRVPELADVSERKRHALHGTTARGGLKRDVLPRSLRVWRRGSTTIRLVAEGRHIIDGAMQTAVNVIEVDVANLPDWVRLTIERRDATWIVRNGDATFRTPKGAPQI